MTVYLSDWNYYKTLTITGSTAGAQSNYVIPIRVYFGSGTDGTDLSFSMHNLMKMYCNGKCKTDFSDIRFALDDGTLLDYACVEYFNSNLATFYIKVDSIPASPNTKSIYIYYGNDNALYIGSLKNTFYKADDFESETLDSNTWTWVNEPTSPSSYSQSNGKFTINSVNTFTELWNNTYTAPQLLTPISESNYEIVTKVRNTGLVSYNSCGILISRDGTNNWVDIIIQWHLMNQRTTAANITLNGVSSSIYASPIYDVDTRNLAIQKVGTTYYVYAKNVDDINYYYCGGAIGDFSPNYAGLYLKSTQVTAHSFSGIWDWIYIRKFVNPEPTLDSWGTEQEIDRVIVASGTDCSISPSGNVTVSIGNNQTFTITPPSVINGYMDDIVIDSVGVNSYLIREGFEGGNFGSWSTYGVGTKVVETVNPHTEIYNAKFITSGNTQQAAISKTISSSSIINSRFFVKINSLILRSQSNNYVDIAVISGSSSQDNATIRLVYDDDSRKTYWALHTSINGVGSQTILGTSEVSTGTWYMVEFVRDTTNGEAHLWINNTLEISDYRSLPNNNTTVNFGICYQSGTGGVELFIDDIIVNTSRIYGVVINNTLTSATFYNINKNHTINAIAALYNYEITVSSPYGNPQGGGTYERETNASISVTSPVSGGTGIRYVCTGYSIDNGGSGQQYTGTSYQFTNIQAHHTIYYYWKTQYYLTVSSTHGTTSGAGWHDDGSTAYAGVNAGTVSGGTGIQYVFSSWSGDASGSNYNQSNSITMNAPKTATANWTTQYYLTVNVNGHSSQTGQGWYNNNSTAYAGVANQTVTSGTTRWVFTSWSGDASGTSYNQSNAITMNAPKTATANWTTQYKLTVTGGYSSTSGYNNNTWVNSGSTITSTSNKVWNTVTGQSRSNITHYNIDGGTNTTVTRSNSGTATTSPITMNSAHTVNWIGVTQYYLTVTGGNSISFGSSSPTSDQWYDSGSSTTVSSNGVYNRSSGTGQRISSWKLDSGSNNNVSTTGTVTTSSITMNTYHTITFNSTTQYQVTLDSNASSGLNSITNPTISGDSYWYDTNVSVTLSLKGVWNRTTNGIRLLGYVINGGANNPVSTTGIITVLNAVAMTQAKNVTTTTTTQYKLTVTGGNGVTYSTSPSISGDVGWYDSGSSTTVSSNGIWNRSGGSGQRVTSYKIDSGSNINVATTGTVTTSSITMNATHTVTFNSTTQYQVTLDTGLTNGLSSLTSPTISNDNYWYDSGTSITVTINGVYGRTSTSGTRITAYKINGGSDNGVSTVGTFKPLNAVSINGVRTLTCTTVTQYKLTVTGGNGVTYGTGSSISGDTGWYNSGTTTTVSSNWVYNNVTNQSRTVLTNYQIDGTNQNPTRQYSGTLTSSSITMSAAHTVTFVSTTQYYIQITSSGIGEDSSGTVATLAGTANTQAQLPYGSWRDTGSSISYSFSSPVSAGSTKRYVWSSISGLSQTLQSNTFTVSTYGIITGTYITQYSVVSSAGSNATISPSGTIWITSGNNQTFTIGANSGYYISQLLIDGSPDTLTTSYTFSNVTSAHTININVTAYGTNLLADPSFDLSTGTYYWSYYNGLTTGGRTGTYRAYVTGVDSWGGRQIINQRINNITPSTTYSLDGWVCGAQNGGEIQLYIREYNSSNTQLTEHGGKIPCTTNWKHWIKTWNTNANTSYIRVQAYCYDSYPSTKTFYVDDVKLYTGAITYTVTATAGTGGSISPSGVVNVNYGTGSQTFTSTPNTDYVRKNMVKDGSNQGNVSSVTFNSVYVEGNHTVEAYFVGRFVQNITEKLGNIDNEPVKKPKLCKLDLVGRIDSEPTKKSKVYKTDILSGYNQTPVKNVKLIKNESLGLFESDPSMLMHVPFNEEEGNISYDISGNENHFTTYNLNRNPIGVFGNEVVGGSKACSRTYIYASNRTVLTSPVIVTKLTVYSGQEQQLALCIYKENTPSSFSLVVQSLPQACLADNWETFIIPRTRLEAGTYWIGLWTNHPSASAVTYTTVPDTTQFMFIDYTLFPNFPTTMTSSTTDNRDRLHSVYATFENCVTSAGSLSEYAQIYPFSFPSDEFSVAFWVKTADTRSGSTIVSYAVSLNSNEILFIAPTSLNVYIGGASRNTGVNLTDNVWHHVVVSWSKHDGILNMYKDGVLVYTSTPFEAGRNIRGDGSLVLFQEQDSVGGGFSSVQTFIGSLSDFYVFNRVVSPKEVYTLYSQGYCSRELTKTVKTLNSELYGNSDNVPIKKTKSYQTDKNGLSDVLSKDVKVYKNDLVGLTDKVIKKPKKCLDENVDLTDRTNKKNKNIFSENVGLSDKIPVKKTKSYKSNMIGTLDKVTKQTKLIKKDNIEVDDKVTKQTKLIKKSMIK